jgi:uncharacterized protein DUF5658
MGGTGLDMRDASGGAANSRGVALESGSLANWRAAGAAENWGGAMSTITGGRRGPAKADESRQAWQTRQSRTTLPLAASWAGGHPRAMSAGARRGFAPRRRAAFSPALVGWLFVYALLNVGDLASTYLGLRAGLREANPLMSGLLLRHGFGALVVYKLVVILAVVGGAVVLHRMHPHAASITVHVCNVLVFLAVALNIAQMTLR